jgi:hypothetical protein
MAAAKSRDKPVRSKWEGDFMVIGTKLSVRIQNQTAEKESEILHSAATEC